MLFDLRSEFGSLGVLDPGWKVGEHCESVCHTCPESLEQELPLFVLESILPLQRLHLNVFEPRLGADLAVVVAAVVKGHAESGLC